MPEEKTIIVENKATSKIEVPTDTKPKKPRSAKKQNKPKIEKTEKTTVNSDSAVNEKKGEKASARTKSKAASDSNNKKQLAAMDAKLSEVLAELEAIKKQETDSAVVLDSFSKALSSNESALKVANRTIVEATTTNKELSMRLDIADAEIKTLRKELASKQSELSETMQKLAASENENIELLKKFEGAVDTNSSLGNDIKAAFIQKLTDALSMNYADFSEYKNAEYSEDNYDTLKVILKGIFRTLSANGIKF
jgi:chromosome segregation ATPase